MFGVLCRCQTRHQGWTEQNLFDLEHFLIHSWLLDSFVGLQLVLLLFSSIWMRGRENRKIAVCLVERRLLCIRTFWKFKVDRYYPEMIPGHLKIDYGQKIDAYLTLCILLFKTSPHWMLNSFPDKCHEWNYILLFFSEKNALFAWIGASHHNYDPSFVKHYLNSRKNL